MLRRLSYGPSLLPKEINLSLYGNESNCFSSFLDGDHSSCLPRSFFIWMKENFASEIQSGKVRIYMAGRGGSCDIHLATENVSSITSYFHCVILQIADSTFILDLGTLNGTMVENKRIEPFVPIKLNMRDQICMGSDGSVYTGTQCVENPFKFIYFKMKWNTTKPHIQADPRMVAFAKSYRAETIPKFTSDILCCVCFEQMKDPYVAPCGHSCCRKCFTIWRESLLSKGYRFVCPLCRSLIDDKPLYPNITLSNIIEAYYTNFES